MNITQKLAQFVTQTKLENLPKQTVHKAKLAFLDWFGVTVAGSKENSALTFEKALAEFSGPPQATIIGQDRRSDIFSAALLNGYFSHVMDYDDIHLEMIGHPSVPVFPALLSLAEWQGFSGKDFICAFVMGVEVACRVGRAVNPEHYDRGWHSTATLGHLGAAAGSAKLFKLKCDDLVNALGIAGTQAGGLRQVFGTMSKPFHPGRAASNGLLAAVLAKRGVNSSQDIIGGVNGFCAVLSDKYDADVITKNLGEEWAVDQIIFKKHASCYRTHAVIECILKLREAVLHETENIKAIHCMIPPLALEMAGIMSPRTPMEGKFSQPFCAAVALLEGEATDRSFSMNNIRHPIITELVGKTLVQVLPTLTSTEAEVNVILQDGTSYRERINTETMTLTLDQIQTRVIHKFCSLIDKYTKNSDVDGLVDNFLNLGKYENLREFTQQLLQLIDWKCSGGEEYVT